MPVGRPRPRLLGADPINRGLVGFWPLSEGAGNIALDLSPNRNTGIAENSVGRAATLYGKAATFAGGGSGAANVNLGTLDGFASAQTQLAISAWVYPTSVSDVKTIFSHYLNYTISGQLAKLLIVNAGVLEWYSTKSSGVYQTATGPSVSAGVWQHVGVSVSGPTSGPSVVLWVGRSTTTATFTATGTPYSPMNHRIGASDLSLSGFSHGWNGALICVRAWNRPLLPNERARIFEDPWAGTAAPSRSARYQGPVVPPAPIMGQGSIVTMPPDFGYPQSITGSPPNPAISA